MIVVILISYLQKLENAKPEDLSKVDQLAFWINAYNAACINLIIQHEKKKKEEENHEGQYHFPS